MKTSPPIVQLPFRRGAVEYALANEADQEAVYQTLLHVFHAPDRETFLGSLSEPSYRPDQRLLVKVDGRIASHVQLTSRTVRYGSVDLPMYGLTWVGTLPEYRGLGFAQNLIRLADDRARSSDVPLLTASSPMARFYRALGWGVCGRQTMARIASRNLPATGGDGLVEAKGGHWHVRPWRQVEISDLMNLYNRQFAHTTGSLVRDEDYWRWIIGRKYAHVIWVACQGEKVRGYAFVKDYKILEIATDPAHPQALRALLGRVRAEALERAYPEVVIHAPIDHPVYESVRQGQGRILDNEEHDGQTSLYHAASPEKFLTAILPELNRRVVQAGQSLPFELGLHLGDHRWLIRLDPKANKLEPDKLGRRYLTLSPGAFIRLAMGHTGIDRALAGEDDGEASTATAVEAARVLFPATPIWRSPLDAATTS
ncbi:MAG: GNAT family N-acetyltransferase [Isosphaeraceae bacterium]